MELLLITPRPIKSISVFNCKKGSLFTLSLFLRFFIKKPCLKYYKHMHAMLQIVVF